MTERGPGAQPAPAALGALAAAAPARRAGRRRGGAARAAARAPAGRHERRGDLALGRARAPSGPARTRSTTSRGSSTTGSSCTATAAARTTARSSTGLGRLDGRTIVAGRPPEGPRREGAARPAVRHGLPRGLRARRCGRWRSPSGSASRSISLVDTPGAYPGVAAEQHGQGGAIARVPGRDVPADGPDGRVHHRRGRLGRRGGDRGLRPGADAGERDLLGDHARGLRGDPLARRRRGEEGGGRVQARRAALPRPRRDRRHRRRAATAARTTDHDGAARLLAAALVEALEELEDTPGEELRRRRRAKFRGMGVFALTFATGPSNRGTFHTIHRVFNREQSRYKHVGARCWQASRA